MINPSFLRGLKLISVVLIFATTTYCQHKEIYEVEAYKINQDWGYCILKNNKIIIKQSTIPTYTNLVRFKSQKDALKVGELVVDRIKNNLSPTITKKDLILLKIENR
ncbi:MAG: DUF4907 domain-containing protein [Flavobacterium sp.]|nr:DUF4907 domain-containing protein [Flavobacterium sp.]